jgi:hypothetical protein
MKKIILSENDLNVIKENINNIMTNKLPKYVYKSVKEHNTSLGDCPAFPPSHDYDFDYKVLKKRYAEIIDEMNFYELPLDEVEAENLLSKLMREAIKKETPIRPQLNKLIENVVNKLFAVPAETINLTCELKDEIEAAKSLRILPEDDGDDNDSYVFADVSEISQVDDIVKQRRFVDSLIQGYAMIASRYEDLYSEYFETHGFGELLSLYNKINALNDYLVFVKKEKIDKKNPSLISYVGVHLGHGNNKTVIRSQGLIFPYLLRETIRGFMELFSSHGLPEDNQKAQMIIKRADFTMAEPWDIRFGKTLWEMMFGKDRIKPNMIPYFFADFCSLETSKFFGLSQELLAKTKKGKSYIKKTISDISNNIDYQAFLKNIQQKNVDSSMITDGYMTADDLDSYEISEEDNIEENQENEYLDSAHGMPLKRFMQEPEEVADESLIRDYAYDIPEFFNNDRDAIMELSDDELDVLEAYKSNQADEEDLLKLLENHPDIKEAFGHFCRSIAYQDNRAARYIYDYNQDVYSNNQWLIHFTPNPGEIALNGFTKGTQDMEELGVTHGSQRYEEGYNFAFIADKATNNEARYYLGHDGYGNLDDNAGAVMFKADGIEAYHGGDCQDQVIFWGPSARNIIPIYHGNVEELSYVGWDYDDIENPDRFYKHRGSTDCWYILGKNDNLLYCNENIRKIITWVKNNYFQYRNELINYTNTKNDFWRPRRKNR